MMHVQHVLTITVELKPTVTCLARVFPRFFTDNLFLLRVLIDAFAAAVIGLVLVLVGSFESTVTQKYLPGSEDC